MLSFKVYLILKNVGTERISRMLTDNVFCSFSVKISNLAVKYPVIVTAALEYSKVRDKLWSRFNTEEIE